MTSYTKALYRRDPAAADAYYTQQAWEQRLLYGKQTMLAQFSVRDRAEEMLRNQRQSAQGQPAQPAFGKRVPTGLKACDRLCGQPACAHGCTLALPSR